MKKTLNINLAGYPFTIDDDAYQLLKDYLDTIRYAFETQEDTEDLAADIESRIAELLIEKEDEAMKIITLNEVKEVIERIGKPSEFIEIEESEININNTNNNLNNPEGSDTSHATITPPPYEPSKYSRNPFVRKRIFRDPQNSMLGGVCAGIANYLHIDVTIVRLITVLLFFLSATTVAIVYIILWIVIPEARTPLQRMQMMGEDTTVENIGKTVTGNYQENNLETISQPKTGFERFLNSALSLFIKVLIFLGLLIAIPVLLGLTIGLVGCIIAVFVFAVAMTGGIFSGPEGWFDSSIEGMMVFYILLAVIGGIITIGIPLWLFFKMLMRKKDNTLNYNYNARNQRALLVIWLCGIAILSVFSVKAVKEGKELSKWEHEQWKIRKDKLKEIDNMDEEDIEGVTFNKNGISFQTKKGEIDVVTKEVTTDKITDMDTVKTEEIIIDTLKIASDN